MSPRRGSLALLVGVLFLLSLLVPAQEKTQDWKVWLDEVEPIMTRTERAVFKSLKTEEDRQKFRSLFWKVRDATPGTPENEFMSEFQSRRAYAEKRLGGARSDRGRIYIILGKPAETQSFAGLQKVVDCELWIYRGEGRSGLPPLMSLLFFRQGAVGEYKLYYPGVDSPVDILDPGATGPRASPQSAYRTIQASYPELAKATLAVIPDEADSAFPMALNSSASTIGLIFTLPEREVERSYLQYFNAPAGTVEVGYSAKQIAGKATVFITESHGVRFLNYSLMPDRISTARTPEGLETAHLVFHLRIEDGSGTTIFQHEKEIRLRLDQPKAEAMRRQKLAFNDFAPLIEGAFRIRLAFTNKTSEEFFVEEREVAVNGDVPSLVLGYQIKPTDPESVLPFSLGPFKALLDPRSIFSRRDALEGLIVSDGQPELFLVNPDEEGPGVGIPEMAQDGGAYRFRLSLANVAPGNYQLVVRRQGQDVFRHNLYVLSFEFEKPLVFERVEPLSSLALLPFAVGQEYLNAGRADKALESFEKLSPGLRTAAMIPVIARAHYLQKDYARVLELLEKDTVEKSYPVLLLLGNSSLELRKLRQAAVYFEEVRKFGDTAEANNTLGAIYYSLGEKDKAKVYWERAKKLGQKAVDKSS